MAAWSHGYFTDVQYTGDFYAELAPGFMAFACLRQMVRPPALGAGSTYLELGCGQGFGLNLLAAANPGMTFHGIDFHPGQIANAQQLAGAAGLANVTFEDLSFQDVAALPDGRLPKFDVVALHGIYSWVSPEDRAAIVRILDRFVKPGGMVYVSYNCLPGWGPLAPVQRLVREYVARDPGDPEAQVVAALRAALKLAEDGALYFTGGKSMTTYIEGKLKLRPAYLIHEYLNAQSEPHFHADVARAMEAARLWFAASANQGDDFIKLAAPARLQAELAAVRDPTWRETLLDYANAKIFRRDIFVRGRNAVGEAERIARLEETPFALLVRPQDVNTTFKVPIGDLKGDPAVYGPIVEALAEGPKSWGQIAALPKLAGVAPDLRFRALSLMVGGRQAHPLTAGGADEAALAFNRAALSRVAFGALPSHLAAPRAGTGVTLDLEDMLAAQGALLGLGKAETVKRGWQTLASGRLRLAKDGQVLPDQAATEAELAARVARFTAETAPHLAALGVIPSK